MNKLLMTTVALAIGLARPAAAEPTYADVDRLTTYAVMLGRSLVV